MRKLSQVKTIGRDAFDSCEQLGEVILPLDLLTINRYAFDNCVLLHSIIFPSKMTFCRGIYFGKNCPKVLIFKGKTPPVLEGDFGYNDDRIEVIYVPIGCSEAYREAPQLAEIQAENILISNLANWQNEKNFTHS